jgi:hypothetical protein
MKYVLTVKQKLSVTDFTIAEPVKNAGENGSFEAQAITFARTQANGYIREWTQSEGLRMRTQKDWVKNLKTKCFEKQVMVQKGPTPLTYVFVLLEE